MDKKKKSGGGGGDLQIVYSDAVANSLHGSLFVVVAVETAAQFAVTLCDEGRVSAGHVACISAQLR